MDTRIIKAYREPTIIPGQVSWMQSQDILYDPRVGVNIIPKHVMDIYFPTQPLSKSNIQLRWGDSYVESEGVLRVIPVMLRDTKLYLDFHVFDIPRSSTPFILVGIPIASMLKSRVARGQMQLQFGKETLDISMRRSLNTRT